MNLLLAKIEQIIAQWLRKKKPRDGPKLDYELIKHIQDAHVLIIDDEVDFCLFLKALFLKKKCSVSIARTFYAANAAINNEIPDVAILNKTLIEYPISLFTS